jgi:hypothetical protein
MDRNTQFAPFTPLALFASVALATACSTGATSTAGFASAEAGTDAAAEPGALDASPIQGLPGADAAVEAGFCGDNICQASETCITCPNDCGECPACSAAPSCTQGVALPSQPQSVSFGELSAPLADADAGVPDGGFAPDTNCDDAQLRLRLSSLAVGHQGKEEWLPTGTLSGPAQSYYCIVQASDGVIVSSSADAGSNGTIEVALTKPTAAIPDFGSVDFGPADSLFWGQAGPRLTQSNLTITYSCFQQAQPGSNSWSSVLSAAAAAAGGLANAGPYGWAFGIGSVALSTVAAAIAAAQQQGDWHMFDVTQTIDQSWMLPLSNGTTWSFTQSGGDAAFQYPWSLTVSVEAWGCADVKPASNP